MVEEKKKRSGRSAKRRVTSASDPLFPSPPCHSVGCHYVILFTFSFKQKTFCNHQYLRFSLLELWILCHAQLTLSTCVVQVNTYFMYVKIQYLDARTLPENSQQVCSWKLLLILVSNLVKYPNKIKLLFAAFFAFLLLLHFMKKDHIF